MSVHLKIDEDLPRQVADLFAERGYDAITVGMQGWSGLPDSELWPRVQQESRWLITAEAESLNPSDFEQLGEVITALVSEITASAERLLPRGILHSEALPPEASPSRTSTVPRHTEIDNLLARKICRQVGVPDPK